MTAVGALALSPASAWAGTASVSGTTLSYVAAPGEVNDTSMFLVDIGQGLGQAVRELGAAPVVAGSGCTTVDAQIAWCGATPTAMDVSLNDLDDTFHSNDLGGTVHGGDGNDRLVVSQFHSGALYGDAGDDRLIPAFGDWALSGGGGDDDMSGGCAGGCAGADSLVVSGGEGTDRFSYAQRGGPVMVTLDGQANDGEQGHHNIGADVENVVGSEGSDTLVGNGAANRLEGGEGADTLQGSGGTDVLVDFGSGNQFDGGAADDRFISSGVAGTDNNGFSGGAGVDTVDLSGRDGGVSVTLDGLANDGGGHENVGADIENVIGTAHDDSLTGDPDANTLDGGAGDDVLRGGPGADTLRGGGGSDTVDYADHAGDVLVTANGQADSGDGTDGPAGARDTVAADLENFTGGAGDDRLVTTPAANRFEGGGGTDTVDYSTVTAAVAVSIDDVADDGPAGEADDVRGDIENVLGGAAGDTLVGNASANRLEGRGGDDSLLGGLGPDALMGGAGSDTVTYTDRSAAIDVIANGAPVSGNTADGAAGARDAVGADVESLVGGSAGDVLTGNGLPNSLDGLGGNDDLDGQGGGDELRGSSGADILRGGSGSDTADYADRTQDLEVDLDGVAGDGEAGEGDNVGPGGDVENVTAGSGSDALFGSTAANRLNGGAGDDLLEGAGGPDVMIGGDGEDVASYLFAPGPVAAAIDGQPLSGGSDDGPVGARDTIGHDIEDLWGGPAGDRLSGDGGDNLLYGGGGADTLTGGAGDDAADYSDRRAGVRAALDGRPDSGNDADGPAGARDTLGSDLEVLFGGSGADTLSGNAGENFFDAGAGDDVINSRDASEDADYCGDGRDTALVDELDLFHTTCEAVYLPGEEPQPSSGGSRPTATPADTSGPALSFKAIRRQRLSRVLAKGLVLAIACSEACSLTGQLTLDAKAAKRLRLTKRRTPVTVARGRAASSGQLVLRFTKQARRRLRRVARVRLTLVVRATDARRNASTVRRRVTLTRKRASMPSPVARGARGAVLAGAVGAEGLVGRAIAHRRRAWPHASAG